MIKKLLLVVLLVVISSSPVYSAEEEQVVLQENVSASFGKVWDAIKACMAVKSCPKPQTEKIIEPDDPTGFYRGIYVSDFCMIVTGEDSTKDFMEVYGVLPKIRGGIWISGRIQYKINVKEEGIRQTKITLKAELSGFEEFITNQIYFWTSNGLLEKEMMAMILEKVNKSVSEDE